MCLANLKDRSLYSLLLCLKNAHLQVGRCSLKITQVNIQVLTFINQNMNLFAQHEKCTCWIYLGDECRNIELLTKNMCFYCVETTEPHTFISRRKCELHSGHHAVKTCMWFVQKGHREEFGTMLWLFLMCKEIYWSSRYVGSAQN